MLHLLQQRDAQRQADRQTEWDRVRARLREVLHCHLPGRKVWIFGSLLQRGRFNAASDIDLAIDTSMSERELGWSPVHTFESGIRATLRWYLDNQAWSRAVQG